jgi:hypothetical protein
MDTLEQRLTADLTDAAEAAMAAGLTPPDRAAIAAGAAARQRRRRLRIGVAVAACVLAVAGAVAALSGDDPSRTEMAPATTGTDRPTPTSTAKTTTSSTQPTDTSTSGTTVEGPGTTTSSTAPNDPEQPGDAPNPVPITEDTVRTIAFPFNQGIEQLPAPCRDYWETTGFTLEGNGLSPDQNGIVIDEATITLDDINGDGTQDGMAAYLCATGGTIPPGGVMALIAEPGVGGAYGIHLDDGSVTTRHEAQFGDPRTRFTGPFELVGDPTGMREITVELDSYRQADANAGASARAIARYRVSGNTLELVDLRQI